MKKGMSPPATKKDIQQMLEPYATKKDLVVLRQELKKEIVFEFQVINENLVKDFRDAMHDQTELLKDKLFDHDARVRRIERHLHLV
jgi:hypothetical protein